MRIMQLYKKNHEFKKLCHFNFYMSKAQKYDLSNVDTSLKSKSSENQSIYMYTY